MRKERRRGPPYSLCKISVNGTHPSTLLRVLRLDTVFLSPENYPRPTTHTQAAIQLEEGQLSRSGGPVPSPLEPTVLLQHESSHRP